MKTLAKILRHRAMVKVALGNLSRELAVRGELHDLSKLRPDELEGFGRLDAAASAVKYGSDEHAEIMSAAKEVVALHHSRNAHHPEHHGSGEMGWLDVVEMACDWWAAWIAYEADKPEDARTSWAETMARQRERFGETLTSFQLQLVESVAEWLEPHEPEETELPAAPLPAGEEVIEKVVRDQEKRVRFVVVTGRLSVEDMVDRVQELADVQVTRTARLHYRWFRKYPVLDRLVEAPHGNVAGAVECTVYDADGTFDAGGGTGWIGEARTRRELDVGQGEFWAVVMPCGHYLKVPVNTSVMDEVVCGECKRIFPAGACVSTEWGDAMHGTVECPACRKGEVRNGGPSIPSAGRCTECGQVFVRAGGEVAAKDRGRAWPAVED